ncbi:MAG: N-acetyl-gamma-glutamyl-phosphate reductase [Gammaproteobacteria bacterium]|nr:N-acetyl-gamma-glutamyl-phosphate reductase [Gammaproteobacteria bacterium]MBT8437888.1 N-acetyl-gamma-glutamyl-phosphate reductase [Gammaproteobacteria bacterium]
MIKLGIVGGTGYTGVELMRLLALHPQAKIEVITSRSQAGRAVFELFPNLRGVIDLNFSEPSVDSYRDCELVFFATPNTTAMSQAVELLEAGVRVIDLAADFRIKHVPTWEQCYGATHACPGLVEEAVYGLPELNREAIQGARLVANPGCYPTSVILALMPLLANGLIDPGSIIADCKSGTSGAGRNASIGTAFCEVTESVKAYAVAGHRHLPEIRAILQTIDAAADLVFTPHLMPMIRGIHATVYADARGPADQVQNQFEDYYRDEPFVDVMPAGSHPETRSVRGTNTCRLAVHYLEAAEKYVVLSVEDNLVKGAAGQAIQNMNLMFGLDETTGLEAPGMTP